MQAQQPDDIAGIAMERQLFMRLVTAILGVRKARIAQIGNMAQQVTFRILRYGIANMEPDTPESDCRLLTAVSFHRNAADKRKPPAIDDIIADGV